MLERLAGARLGGGQLDLAPETLAREGQVRPPGHRESERGARRAVGWEAEPGVGAGHTTQASGRSTWSRRAQAARWLPRGYMRRRKRSGARAIAIALTEKSRR